MPPPPPSIFSLAYNRACFMYSSRCESCVKACERRRARRKQPRAGKGTLYSFKVRFLCFFPFPLLDSAASAGGDGRRHDQEKNKKEVFFPSPLPFAFWETEESEIAGDFVSAPSVRPSVRPASLRRSGRIEEESPLLPRERGEAVSEKKSWRNPTFFVHVCSARRPPNGRTDGGKRKRKSSQDMLTRRYTEKKEKRRRNGSSSIRGNCHRHWDIGGRRRRHGWYVGKFSFSENGETDGAEGKRSRRQGERQMKREKSFLAVVQRFQKEKPEIKLYPIRNA